METKLEKFDTDCQYILNKKMRLLNNWKIISPIESLDEDAFIQRKSNSKYFDRILKELKDSVSHICSSPLREDIFYKAYCWPNIDNFLLGKNKKKELVSYKENPSTFKSDLDENRNNISINASEECTNYFVDFLCKKSAEEPHGRTTGNNQRVIFLTGDYGEGKTFFINYILSTKQKQFNNNNVINIKLDYTDPNVSNVSVIDTAIAKKTIRIIKDKYLTNRTIVNSLCSYINKQQISKFTKRKFINFLKIGNPFKLNDEESVILFEIEKTFFSNGAINSTKINYSFLFIIDGIDNVHRDTVSSKKFYSNIEKLNNFVSSRASDSLYLIVMRHESHRFLGKDNNLGRLETNIYRNFSLFPASSEEIIYNKFEVFRNFLMTLNVTGKNEESIDIAIEFIDLIDKYRLFLNKFIKYSFTKKIDDNNFSLERLLNNNNRDIMNSIYVISRDIFNRIENHSKVNDWKSAKEKLIHFMNNIDDDDFIRYNYFIPHRSLMLNKRYYALEQFVYDQNNENNEEFNPLRYLNYDERTLIPNIFNICKPSIKLDDTDDDLSNPSTMPCYCYRNDKITQNRCIHVPFLIKLRILQYLKYYNGNGIYKKIIDIKDDLHKDFGYQKQSIQNECEMLYSTQCIKKRNTIFGYNFDSYIFEINFMGKFIIDNLIYSYHYLENVVDNAVITQAYCENTISPPVSIAEIQDFNKKLLNFEINKINKSEISDEEYAIKIGKLKHDFFTSLGSVYASKMIKIKAFANFIHCVENDELNYHKRCNLSPEYIYPINFSKTIIENVNSTIKKLIQDSEFVSKYIIPILTLDLEQNAWINCLQDNHEK